MNMHARMLSHPPLSPTHAHALAQRQGWALRWGARWLRAKVRAFEEMERDERVTVDVAAMNALVDALARSGQMEAALQALDRALYLAQSAGEPSRHPRFTKLGGGEGGLGRSSEGGVGRSLEGGLGGV
jgi:pentatricopeptide repeat protein